jgi:hypothetical protein
MTGRPSCRGGPSCFGPVVQASTGSRWLTSNESRSMYERRSQTRYSLTSSLMRWATPSMSLRIQARTDGVGKRPGASARRRGGRGVAPLISRPAPATSPSLSHPGRLAPRTFAAPWPAHRRNVSSRSWPNSPLARTRKAPAVAGAFQSQPDGGAVRPRSHVAEGRSSEPAASRMAKP